MSTGDKTKKNRSEIEIDQIVVAQADNDSAWERPVYVHRAKPASVAIPADLAARAAFLARLHRKKSVEEWLQLIIQERVELEEAAFVGMKHDLTVKAS
ncbi:MAG TPA: hypothetical protein VGD14_23785 [bacterium]